MDRYIKRQPARPASMVTNQTQGILDLRIDREAEIEGVGMGVLSDGTPFLNQRGLARICGVQNAHIGTISSDWNDEAKPRIAAIKKILADRGLQVSTPHIVVSGGSRVMYAYSDAVCMAVLEYYAFDAGTNVQEEAKRRYRWLAGRSLREIIYSQLGYQPQSEIAETWQQFHDRVSLVYDSVPNGYFCVFKEIADLMVALINAGAPVGKTFVPDISVGLAWGKHWVANSLADKYGERLNYEHYYPDYFPQAISNPQTPYCYPETALHEFRRYMRDTYLPKGLPSYLETKVRQGQIHSSVSNKAIKALAQREQKRPLLK